MKGLKMGLVLLLAGLVSGTVLATENYGSGKYKLGGVLGKPLLLSAGIPVGENMELGVFFGYDYSVGLLPYESLVFGIDYMFVLTEINIQDELFPLSLGPRVSVNAGLNGLVFMDILAMLRFEYTFGDPVSGLNLYAELGPGIKVNLVNPPPASGMARTVPAIWFAVQGGIGVRYAFGN